MYFKTSHRTYLIGCAQDSTVEVLDASRGGAVVAGATLRNHHDREVVTVDQADVEEIEASGAVEGELGEGGRRRGAAAGAFELAGAAVAGDAGELSGGVLGAEGAAPEAATPRGGCGDGLGLAGSEGEAGVGKRVDTCV